VRVAPTPTEVRRFVVDELRPGQAVTAEWLAGRLGAPLYLCRACLADLVEAGLLTCQPTEVGRRYWRVRRQPPAWRALLLDLLGFGGGIVLVSAGAVNPEPLAMAAELATGLLLVGLRIDWALCASALYSAYGPADRAG
jgi:hypothetical protein